MTLPLLSIELLVDEALYHIVWYGPLMVAVFTLLPLYTNVLIMDFKET